MQIYRILNIINGKSYIGQTKNTFRIRYNCRDDWWNISSNIALKGAVNKYGAENFKIEIIFEEKFLNQELLNELERFYIKKFNSLSPDGYNLTTGGETSYSHTEQAKEKNRLAHLGVPANGKNKKGHKKPKELVEKITETKRRLYKEGKITPWNKGLKTGPMKPEHIKNSAKGHHKKVAQLDKLGNIVKIFDSVKSTRLDGFNPSQVTGCCKGYFKSHRGYYWKNI